MKKKIVRMIWASMTMIMLVGCGAKSEVVQEVTEATEDLETEVSTTEAVIETQPGIASVDMEYNVDDYVTLGDYNNIEITLKNSDYEVTEEDMDTYAQKIIDYYMPYLPDESKKTVEKGDVVDADYVGKKDGVPFEGGSAAKQLIDTAKNADASTGTGFVSGFADGLVGMSVGETKDWEVTFPADYSAEDLKGQTVTFTFTVNALQKKVTKEDIDDAYVQQYMEMESVDAFYENLKKMLEQEAENGKLTDTRTKVLDAVIEKCTVTSFPEGLLEKRMEEYIEIFKRQYCPDGTDFETVLQQNFQQTTEEFLKTTEEYVEKSLKEELIFQAIAKKENIAFNEEEYQNYINNIISSGTFPSEDELYLSYGPTVEAGRKYMENIYLQTMACVQIADKAKVNYLD